MNDDRKPALERKHLEALLDEALDEGFPASDPVAVHREDRGDDPDAESQTGQGR